METTKQVARIIEEWRRLTHAEGLAIRNEAWDNVAQCQNDKGKLRSLLDATMAKWNSEHSAASPDGLSMRGEFRTLIALEQLNAEAIAAQMQAARDSKSSLKQASLNLRRVHHSYVPKTEEAWHSYS